MCAAVCAVCCVGSTVCLPCVVFAVCTTRFVSFPSLPVPLGKDRDRHHPSAQVVRTSYCRVQTVPYRIPFPSSGLITTQISSSLVLSSHLRLVLEDLPYRPAWNLSVSIQKAYFSARNQKDLARPPWPLAFQAGVDSCALLPFYTPWHDTSTTLDNLYVIDVFTRRSSAP